MPLLVEPVVLEVLLSVVVAAVVVVEVVGDVVVGDVVGALGWLRSNRALRELSPLFDSGIWLAESAETVTETGSGHGLPMGAVRCSSWWGPRAGAESLPAWLTPSSSMTVIEVVD